MEQEVLDAPTLSAVKIYNPIEAGIALMLEKHGHVLRHPPVVKDDPKAMALAKTGERELIKFRTSLEQARKTEKADSLAYGRLVDSEAARIQAVATPLELAYKNAITDEESRLEAIRQQALEAERQRITGHRARIQAIKEVRETANMCRTADRLKQLIDGMPAHLEQPFEEFQGEAETAFNEVCTVLQQLHGAKLEAEAQASELKRQQEELARQRTEQAAIDLAASQARAAEEAAAQARRDAEASELARQRAAFEQEQAAARALQQAEADQLAAEREAVNAERVATQKRIDDMAAAELLAASRPAPMTAQDIAEGVVDAEVKPDGPLVLTGETVIVPLMPFQPVQAEETPPTLRLGQISTHLGFAVTADFLRSLGFEPAGRERAAVLYHASSWPLIQAALVNHINTLPALQVA